MDAIKSAAPFKHGGRHAIGHVTLFDSYHCSRYNTNTGVLTPEMFRAVFSNVRDFLGGEDATSSPARVTSRR
jgi:uracil-DNA glycosylase